MAIKTNQSTSLICKTYTMIAIIAFSLCANSGCTVLKLATKRITDEIRFRHSNKKIEKKVSKWGKAAFVHYCSKNGIEDPDKDFFRGYLAGFEQVVLKNDSRPPAVLPDRYQSARFATSEGKKRYNQWQDGFHEGVAAAHEGSYRQLIEFQITPIAIETVEKTYYTPPQLLTPSSIFQPTSVPVAPILDPIAEPEHNVPPGPTPLTIPEEASKSPANLPVPSSETSSSVQSELGDQSRQEPLIVEPSGTQTPKIKKIKLEAPERKAWQNIDFETFMKTNGGENQEDPPQLLIPPEPPTTPVSHTTDNESATQNTIEKAEPASDSDAPEVPLPEPIRVLPPLPDSDLQHDENSTTPPVLLSFESKAPIHQKTLFDLPEIELNPGMYSVEDWVSKYDELINPSWTNSITEPVDPVESTSTSQE